MASSSSLISVVKPKAISCLTALLARLARQTLGPERFEAIIVDDGSPAPIQLPSVAPSFCTHLLRQPNAGPGAARNLALSRCAAPLALILNDDAAPAPDLLERHLAIHADAPGTSEIVAQQQAAIDGTQADRKPQPIRNRDQRVGRNDPCPCGSGKKYKRCCGRGAA